MMGTMEQSSPDLVHVVFPLEVDEHGWPPVSGERVWAEPVGDGLYRLANVPWFVRGVAEGDVVRAEPPDDRSWPVFQERVQWSGYCTVRVIPFSAGALHGSQEAVLEQFEPFGVTGEVAGSYPIVALSVPPDADLPAVKDRLRRGTQAGWWEYEEGCVSEEWIRL